MRIQAQFLIVDPQRILTNAQIVVRHGRISELHETPQLQPDLNLKNTVILPGLINSHTHLEFSDFSKPIESGPSFTDWISEVVKHRRLQAEKLSPSELIAARKVAIRAGASECCRSGTALAVDVITQPWKPDWLYGGSSQITESCELPSRMIVLAEVLGLELHRLKQNMEWARELLRLYQDSWVPEQTFQVGISPHAPYSLLHPEANELFLASPIDSLMAMHVAESLEEREWLEHGTGPFREFYHSLNLPINPRRMQIPEAIEMLSCYRRSLLIHGNYLTADELEQVASSSIAMVYCPRTHQHFAHRPYPLKEIVQRHIPMLLGTDSRASNPDLNLWDECKTAYAVHRYWSATEVLSSVTNSAAKVLGMEKDLGSLDIGKLAWLNTIPTPTSADAENLLQKLFLSSRGYCPQRIRIHEKSCE